MSSMLENQEIRRKREAQDFLAVDIAKGDDDVCMTVRAAIERGYASTFMESLDDALKKKESEIERICARYYSEFLASVANVLTTKSTSKDLMTTINEINNDFSKAGDSLVTTLESLNDLTSERDQTRSVLENIMTCREIALLMVTIKKHVDEKQYYQAVSDIEKLYQSVEGTSRVQHSSNNHSNDSSRAHMSLPRNRGKGTSNNNNTMLGGYSFGP